MMQGCVRRVGPTGGRSARVSFMSDDADQVGTDSDCTRLGWTSSSVDYHRDVPTVSAHLVLTLRAP